MNITVLSGLVLLDDVSEALRQSGLVVLETTRTHASEITNEVCEILGVDKKSESEPSLLHLAVEVESNGFSDYLIYTDVFPYDRDKVRRLVIHAVSKWMEAGSPDKFVAKCANIFGL